MTQATGNVPPGRAGRNLGAVALAALCVVAAAGLYLYENHGQLYPRTSAPGTTVAGASAPSATALGASASGNAKPGASAPAAAPASAAVPPRPAQTASAAPTSPAAAPVATPGTAAANTAAPSVDVVRLDKSGALVMAGRAAPGETLTIQNGDATLGTVVADNDGQWVFLPDATLPTGVHQLSVSGQSALAGNAAAKTTVLLSLPSAINAAQSAGPMVVLSQGSAAPRLLEGPSGHSGPVGLDIVQYDDQGRIRFTGHAQPGHVVRLYVNNKAVGDALADAKGVWSLVPTRDLKPGLYRLRTDELTPNGKVVARSEVPFARADLAQSLASGEDVVQPGDCLWTIARHNYGHGVQYTAIFVKNMDQIRDPDKIYPGQVFHMPTAIEAAHPPAVSTVKTLKRGETS